MKKLLAVLVAICCLSAIFCVSVSAAGEKEVLVVVENSDGSIKVDINAGFACGAIQGALKYDGDQIVYQSSNIADALAAANAPSNSFANSSGTTKVALVCAANGGVQGNLASVTYSADEYTPALFDFTALKAFGAAGERLNDVSVVTVMYGDANNNGLVTVTDLVRFKRILLNETSVVAGKERNLDVNKDGVSSTVNDMMELRRSLLD